MTRLFSAIAGLIRLCMEATVRQATNECNYSDKT